MAIIQWFPGHMAKARRQVLEQLHLVDIVFELVDARLPESSRNPMLDDLLKQKPRLLILNKVDLADRKLVNEWVKYYESQGIPAIAFNSKEGIKVNLIEKKATEILGDKLAHRQERGLKPRSIRAMCVGIPNVGKSTLLNRLIKKNIAKTGNKPGVTKKQQWLKIGKTLELLDTPGILWPKFEDPEVGQKLALSGAIKDTIFHKDDIAIYTIQFFRSHYPGRLEQTYGIDEANEALSNIDLLMALTAKLGFKEDYDQCCEKLIYDVRKGRVGPFTLDQVPKSVNIADSIAEEDK